LCLPEFQKNDLQAKCSKEMALQSYKQKPVPIQDSNCSPQRSSPYIITYIPSIHQTLHNEEMQLTRTYRQPPKTPLRTIHFYMHQEDISITFVRFCLHIAPSTISSCLYHLLQDRCNATWCQFFLLSHR
jgi:hypothetical protein